MRKEAAGAPGVVGQDAWDEGGCRRVDSDLDQVDAARRLASRRENRGLACRRLRARKREEGGRCRFPVMGPRAPTVALHGPPMQRAGHPCVNRLDVRGRREFGLARSVELRKGRKFSPAFLVVWRLSALAGVPIHTTGTKADDGDRRRGVQVEF